MAATVATQVALDRKPAASDAYARYRGQLLSTAEVRSLSRLSWYRPVLDVAWCWTWIVAAWVVVAIWPVWYVVVPAMVVIATRFYALFVIAHDGFHRRLARRAWVNDLFADVAILGSIGAITRLNSSNHMLHHRHLASEADPDRHKYGCFNKSTPAALVGYLTGATSVTKSMRNAFLNGGRRVSDNAPRENDGYRLRDLLILGVWQMGLLAGLTLAIGWWAYPVLWLIPVYCGFLLDNLRSFCEHSQPQADPLADTHRLITYRSNPLERFFLAPMNMNYHAAHHLWPSIPYYRLPEADRQMFGRPEAEGLEWRDSYVGYLWRYFRRLPLDECGAHDQEPSSSARWRRRPR